MDGSLENVLEEIADVTGASGFAELLAKYPQLSGSEIERQLEMLAAIDGYGALFGHLLELIRGARTDLEGAWKTYESALARAEQIGSELRIEMDAITTASDRREFERVLVLVDAALPKARQAGLGIVVCDLYAQAALALLQRNVGSRADDLEGAIGLFEAALPLSPDPERTTNLLMHLAIAYVERVRGDRSENIDRAVGLLRNAVAEATGVGDPELRVMAQTNLATALLRREQGDRAANLREAAQLCRVALKYRSPQRDAANWGYSQLNLGEALDELSALLDQDSIEARHAYERVIEERDRIADRWLVGAAYQGLGRWSLRDARNRSQALLESERLDPAPEESSAITEALAAARDQLHLARDLSEGGPDRLRYGRILSDLSDALVQLEDHDQAVEVAREALAILRPTSDPRACLAVGARLGDLLAARGEWNAAAAAFRDAVEAADLSFHGRLDTHSRQYESRRAGNVNRWAAYAIAESGDSLGAALVLENGRAREIRRRLGVGGDQDAQLAHVPAHLRREYEEALVRLVASPFGSAGDAAGRQLQRVLEAIRQIPGLGDFATGASADHLAGAVEPAWPLVYVNPTPYGTLFLSVAVTAGGLSIYHDTKKYPTSMDVFMRLAVGAAAERDDALEEGETSSYLFGLSGHGATEREFKPSLDELLPWLGDALSKPLRDLLVDASVTGCTLILCGPLAIVPLHAASWREDGRHRRCLLDEFDIRYAPSASLARASLDRAHARARDRATLVALGDPNDDLPAARPEVEEIARHFALDDVVSAFVERADQNFLRAHARQAKFLHLACHATADPLQDGSALILLADGPMSARDLTGLGGLAARLVAVSACQSGLAEIADLPNEVISIGTSILAAGGACVVASLWAVHDLATALLMTRLYEEIFACNHRPPEALRRAQIWLRDMSDADESRFLAEHPALAAEFRRRSAEARAAGTLRRKVKVSDAGRPYSHPDYWAAFVAVGA